MYNSYYHTVQYNMQYDATCVRYEVLAREARAERRGTLDGLWSP